MDIETQIKNAAKRNTELLQILRETDYAEPTFVQHNRFIDQVQRDIQESEKKQKTSNFTRQQLQKKHESYRDSHVKRFLFKASGNKEKFQQKAEDGEKEYFQILQDIQNQEKFHASLVAQLSEALDIRPTLENAATAHKNAQAELDTLYSSIFSGPTPQFPNEDAKENACVEAGKMYRSVKMAEEAETVALKQLQGATRYMGLAHQSLQSAAGYSRMDMFGGGTMTDMMERSHLSDAEVHMENVRVHLTRAQQASNQVGQFPQVRIHHGSLMTDVFFDNIFTDYEFHQQIKRAIGEWQRLMQAVERERQAAQQRVNGARSEAAMREQQLESARIELQKEREELFERVSRGESVPAVAPEGASSAATRDVEPLPSSNSKVDRPASPPPAYTDAAEAQAQAQQAPKDGDQNDEWWK